MPCYIYFSISFPTQGGNTMKQSFRELLPLILILATALAIVLGFFLYDASLPLPEKRSRAYSFAVAGETSASRDAGSSGQEVEALPTVPASPSASSSAAPTSGAEIVYVSMSGAKYHSRPDCGSMNPDTAQTMARQEAEQAGKSSCSRCFPAE